MMDSTEIFVTEQGNSSLPYVFSPVTLLSCLVVLLCGFVVMPLIGPRISSKYGQLKDDRKRFNTALGSNLHHIIVSPLAIYALISGALSNRIMSDSALGFVLMQTSLGYFIGDTILFLSDPKMRYNALFLFHHFMGIFGYATGLTLQGKGMFFPISFQVVEISAFLINLQRAMSMVGVSKDSCAFKSITHIMTVAYFFTRIVTIPWQWYEFILFVLDPASQIIPLYFKIYTFFHFIIVHLLFIYWFVLIIKKYYLKRGKQRKA